MTETHEMPPSLLAKVLVPLDGSELATRVLHQLRRLLRRPETAVRLVSVLREDDLEALRAQGDDPWGPAVKRLELAAKPLLPAAREVTWDVLVGDAAARIIEDAAEEKVSLIALATHGRSGVERWLRGSVAERILRASPVPVLVSNPRGVLNEVELRRILVALDGSERSNAILPVVGELAHIYGAQVTLARALEAPPGFFPTGTLEPRVGAAQAALDQAKERLQGVAVRTVVLHGEPADAILAAADSEDADLVALTTHGRTGLDRWAFGSTAEQVVRHCSRPLLVQRTVQPGR